MTKHATPPGDALANIVFLRDACPVFSEGWHLWGNLDMLPTNKLSAPRSPHLRRLLSRKIDQPGDVFLRHGNVERIPWSFRKIWRLRRRCRYVTIHDLFLNISCTDFGQHLGLRLQVRTTEIQAQHPNPVTSDQTRPITSCLMPQYTGWVGINRFRGVSEHDDRQNER